MASQSLTNELTFNINVFDNKTQAIKMTSNGDLPYLAYVGVGIVNITLPVGDNVIPLPKTTVFQVYVKNVDEQKNIDLKINSAASGGLVTVVSLWPQDVWILWANPNVNVSGGITGLTISVTGSDTQVEYFIGA